GFVFSSNVEIASSTNCYFANVSADFLTSSNNGFDYMACPESKETVASFLACSRKAILIHFAHLTTSISYGFDKQWLNSINTKFVWCTCSYTSSIYVVSFWQTAFCSVELR